MGAKNNWDQDRDQAIAAILCNSSSNEKMLGSKPMETVHLKDFFLRKILLDIWPPALKFSCFVLSKCLLGFSFAMCFWFCRRTFLFLKDSIKQMTHWGLQASSHCILLCLTVLYIIRILKMWVSEVLVKISMKDKVGGVDRCFFKVIWIFKV